jgi:receptor protein-tyrosine kinase
VNTKPGSRQQDPQEQVVHELRALRASIELACHKLARSVVLLSPDNSVPTADAVWNLGLAFWDNTSPPLLVDTDMANPGLHLKADLDLAPGLRQWLEQKGQPDLAPTTAREHGLLVLAAGCSNEDPLQWLNSESIGWCAPTLMACAERVIWRTPPLDQSPVGMLLAESADAVLMAVRPGHTRRSRVNRARRTLDQAGIAATGTILVES